MYIQCIQYTIYMSFPNKGDLTLLAKYPLFQLLNFDVISALLGKQSL